MKHPPRWRELWASLLGEHTGPLRLGAAVGLGVIIGCTPFFGLQILMALGLAVLLRLNKVAVVLGAQISIPPLAPLLGYASVQLGSLVLEGHWLRLAPADFQLGRLPTLLRSFFLAWLVGGLVLGLALALPAFGLTAALVRWRRGRAAGPDVGTWRAARRAVQRAFAGAPAGHRGYVRGKLAMDPVYRQICRGLGRVNRVLDLGTGLGLLPLLLAARGQARELVGLEWDAAKLESARRAATGASTRLDFVQADVRTEPLPKADAVLLVDVLHYYPAEEQRALLARAAAALRPAGRLVVRETDREARSLLTRLLERAAVRLRWNKGPGLHYSSAAELRAELERLGLRVRVEPASSALHRGNLLLWGERTA